jgi:hypothetical protein
MRSFANTGKKVIGIWSRIYPSQNRVTTMYNFARNILKNHPLALSQNAIKVAYNVNDNLKYIWIENIQAKNFHYNVIIFKYIGKHFMGILS